MNNGTILGLVVVVGGYLFFVWLNETYIKPSIRKLGEKFKENFPLTSKIIAGTILLASCLGLTYLSWLQWHENRFHATIFAFLATTLVALVTIMVATYFMVEKKWFLGIIQYRLSGKWGIVMFSIIILFALYIFFFHGYSAEKPYFEWLIHERKSIKVWLALLSACAMVGAVLIEGRSMMKFRQNFPHDVVRKQLIAHLMHKGLHSSHLDLVMQAFMEADKHIRHGNYPPSFGLWLDQRNAVQRFGTEGSKHHIPTSAWSSVKRGKQNTKEEQTAMLGIMENHACFAHAKEIARTHNPSGIVVCSPEGCFDHLDTVSIFIHLEPYGMKALRVMAVYKAVHGVMKPGFLTLDCPKSLFA